MSSVDAEASAIGLEVLRKGGNAADAAVATAAALGVTEPYSAGIGGGGYFVYFDAATGEVTTIDGRETAPAAMPATAFIDPATGQPYAFAAAVSSGLSVGVPGTLATWEAALDRFGTESLKEMLKPSILLATRGFRVDETFVAADGRQPGSVRGVPRRRRSCSSRTAPRPWWDRPSGTPTWRRPCARSRCNGTDAFYEGAIADEIAAVVQHPVATPSAALSRVSRHT